MTERATGELFPQCFLPERPTGPHCSFLRSSGSQPGKFEGALAVPRAWLHKNQLHLLLWMWCQNFLLMLDPERVSNKGSFL